MSAFPYPRMTSKQQMQESVHCQTDESTMKHTQPSGPKNTTYLLTDQATAIYTTIPQRMPLKVNFEQPTVSVFVTCMPLPLHRDIRLITLLSRTNDKNDIL